MYDRDELAWDELVKAGHEFLIERARLQKVTSYTEMNTVLARRTGQAPFDFSDASDRAAMGYLLGRVVEDDMHESGLMLSALVHYLDRNDAGPGFYALAAQLGLLPRGAGSEAKFEFWVRQVNAIHDYYAPGAKR